MARLKVEGHTSLERDIYSNGIVNTNRTEYQVYMSRHKNRQKQGDELRGAIKEINTLKQELFEIKKLLKGIKN